MTEKKSLIENRNFIIIQPEENKLKRIQEREESLCELLDTIKRKTKQQKTTCELLVSQKKMERKEQKNYLKKSWLGTS